MEKEKSAAKKRLIIFTSLTIVIAWFVFMLIPICGLTYGKGTVPILILAGAMFVPALSSILTRLITKEGFHNMYLRPRFKGHAKYYLFSYFAPTLLIILSAAVYFLIFPGLFDPQFSTIKQAAEASGKTAANAELVIFAQSLEILIIGPIVNIIPTLGEELGWRGYLLPKLRMFFSDRAALVITGAIWGVWHAPIIAMGHNYGTKYLGYPWLGIFAMIVFCVALGIVEGYITIKVGSAIPAAMIHSAVNAGAGFPIYMIKGGYNTLLGPAITGLVGGLPLIMLAVILFIKAGNKTSKIDVQGIAQELSLDANR
ncbi:MAG: type II CAAX endopeptidase family protein [Bacillota bacterium]|nr:type II CAAX endopeptidase family protein [Bacillota bacterium]